MDVKVLQKCSKEQQTRLWHNLKSSFPDIQSTKSSNYVLLNTKNLTQEHIEFINKFIDNLTNDKTKQWEKTRQEEMTIFQKLCSLSPEHKQDEEEFKYEDSIFTVKKVNKRRNYLKEYGTDDIDSVIKLIQKNKNTVFKDRFSILMKQMQKIKKSKTTTHTEENMYEYVVDDEQENDEMGQEDMYEECDDGEGGESEDEQPFEEVEHEVEHEVKHEVEYEVEQEVERISAEIENNTLHDENVQYEINRVKRIMINEGIECNVDTSEHETLKYEPYLT